MNSSNATATETGSNELTRPGDLRVVVVDDSNIVREHVVDSLRAVDGVAVIGQAADVPSGLELVGSSQPDVIVLDIEMPGQSGLDLLKIVRATNRTSVVIMFSIYDHPQLRQKCKDLGANFYFHKLREFEEVAEVCRDLVDRRQGRDDSSTFAGQE